MAKNNSNDSGEKSWTVSKLRTELEKSYKGGALPPDFLLTAKILWRHIPLEYLPILPEAEGVTWAPLQAVMTPQPLATWRDPWSIATGKRTLEVCITSRELDCEFTLDIGKGPEPFTNLQSALHYLTV